MGKKCGVKMMWLAALRTGERDRWGEGEAAEGSDLPLARTARVVAGIVMKPAHD